MATSLATAVPPNDDPEELFSGRVVEQPFLSIIIPTYERPELLREAVISALEQDFDLPFEVIVMDNDPSSLSHELLIAALPRLRDVPFRYLRNRRDFGESGNCNRGIAEARGEWITILHDDDLLHRSWTREMFALLAARPDIDGLMCRRFYMDQRKASFKESRLKSIARRIVTLQRFGFGATCHLGVRKLFWECPGNIVGFVARKRDVKAAGCFRTDMRASSDYFFYLNFSKLFLLHEYRKVLVSIRIADNSLLRLETHLDCVSRNQEIRSACIAAGAPRWWTRLIPLMVARQVEAMSRYYRVPMTPAEVGQLLGIQVPRDRPLLLWTIRAACGGF